TIDTVVDIDGAGPLAFGEYRNTAVGAGDPPSGAANRVTDNSTDGIDPDADGDNTDGTTDGDGLPDEATPTPVNVTLTTQIGAAKQASDPVANGDGSFNVTYTLVAENLGNIALFDVQVSDELTAEFGTVVAVPAAPGEYNVANLTIIANAADPLSENTAFDGSAANNGIFDTAAGGSLSVGETVTVTFDVRFVPDFAQSPFRNQAIASGDTIADGAAGGDTTDLSDDGSDPDPGDGAGGPPNGNPTDADENDPTEIVVAEEPVIGVSNAADVLGKQVTLRVRVQNFGNVALSNIGLINDLDATFGAGNYIPGTPVIATPPATSTVTLNPAYSGAAGAGAELFDPSGSALAMDEFAIIEIPVRITRVIDPDGAGPLGVGEYLNQVMATGDPPSGAANRVNDMSTDGEDPDADGDNADGTADGDLAPTEDKPTPIRIDPQGVVYDSADRTPIAGVESRFVDANGVALPAVCLAAGQQPQVSGQGGTYQFDVFPGADPACPLAQSGYRIEIVRFPQEFEGLSTVIPNQAGPLDASNCAANGMPVDVNPGAPCEVQGQATAPTTAQPTPYYLNFTLGPGGIDIVNNHIPLDRPAPSIVLSKTTDRRQVSVGDLVGYTLRAENTAVVASGAFVIRDDLPAGFSYIADSAQLRQAGPDSVLNTDDDVVASIAANGVDPVTFGSLALAAGEVAEIRYLTRLGSGVPEGRHINRAQPLRGDGSSAGNEASASVEVTQDPILEKTTLIGKVFHDRDGDGWQDPADATRVRVHGGVSDATYVPGTTTIDYGGGAEAIADASSPLTEGIEIELLPGRTSEAEQAQEVVIRAGINGDAEDVIVTTAQGSRIIIDPQGVMRTEHEGRMKRGLTGQVMGVSVEVERPAAAPSATVTRTVTDAKPVENDVAVVRFRSGRSDVSAATVARIDEALKRFAGKPNLRVRFTGHTDSQPLGPRAAAKYGDNQGLSEARARTVADVVKRDLKLTDDMIEIAGFGPTRPLESNDTPAGMARNRRVVIQVVYDEISERTEVEQQPAPPPPGGPATLVITVANHGLQEEGIPGVRLATVTGLLIETDQYGRYHVADVDGGLFERGRNTILKVDPATLPEHTVFTTENPRVLRITQALMSKINFGVKLPAVAVPSRVERVETGEGRYEKRKETRTVTDTRTVKLTEVVPPIRFASGKSNITAAYAARVREVLDRYQDKDNVRLHLVGHTDSQRLSARTARIYTDNHGLSRARLRGRAAVDGGVRIGNRCCHLRRQGPGR
ncbi:MAG: OmpA family protein, partial [Gammaproteobacteria bacterium]